MAQVKVITVKRFTYRGQDEEWSNAYHLSGSAAADEAAAHVVINELRDAEKACWTSDVVFMRGYFYDPGAVHATYVYDQSASALSFRQGTLSATGSIPAPGDDAMWVRWDTGQLNSKGKRIWLRKYFHGVRLPTSGGDSIVSGQLTALGVFQAALVDGLPSSGRKITDAAGHFGVNPSHSTFSTTRTLKRRGRRPPPP